MSSQLTTEGLKARIAELNRQIDALKSERDLLEIEQAKSEAQFQIGQVVRWVTESWRSKKTILYRARITQIRPGYAGPKYWGVRLLKNGNDGQIVEIPSWHHPQLEVQP